MKMDWLRNTLIGGILLVAFLLIIRWSDFKERQVASLAPSSAATVASSASQPAQAPETGSEFDIAAKRAQATNLQSTSSASVNRLSVQTDTLALDIDLNGGDIVKAALLQHQTHIVKDPADAKPLVLLTDEQHLYIARSGLIGPNGTDSGAQRPVFTSEQTTYTLGDAEKLRVTLRLQQGEVTILKHFDFTRGSYVINLGYEIHNSSSSDWEAGLVASIKRDAHNPVVSAGLGVSPFLGAATSTLETNYDKYSFEDLAEKPFSHTREGGWVAMVQHYFVSAWVPDPKQEHTYTLRKGQNEDVYYLSFSSQALKLAPGSKGEIQAQFYVGPKDVSELEKIAPFLDLTVDYGFLWMIAKPLFQILDWLHGYVNNWGIAIILLTVLVKILFFYPSAISYRSMAKMRKVQPKMLALKDQYGHDRQRMSQELMKLYRTEKVNPVSGCLPMLLQMPVFIALYWALMESVELRHASFLWMNDLSVKDPIFVLPLVMGLTMWIQQKLNPAPTDPMQAKVMQWMPVLFTGLFLVFPAGLVLYWVVNNTLSILQQWIITRQIEAEK